MRLKEFMKYYRDDINQADLLEVLNTDGIEFLKGDNKEEQGTAFNELITKCIRYFDTIDIQDFINNTEDYNFAEDMTIQEFIVFFGSLLDFVFIGGSEKERGETYQNFTQWLFYTLEEVIKEEDKPDFFGSITTQKICGVFYFAPASVQNVFLAYLVLNILTLIKGDISE